MQTCPHCGSEVEQTPQGCCPLCGQALALPSSEKDVWFPYHPTEQLFQHTCAVLLTPAQPVVTPTEGRRRWFVVTLVLFALVLLAFTSAIKVGIIVGVVFLHELGHYAAMRFFGYRDVSIFFIPFFGAAATGVKERAPVWQQVIVLLMGPVPGLILGCFLWIGLAKVEHPVVCELASWLVALNLLNLAPLEPLDGGRLVNLLLFYRRPLLEAGVLVASAVTLAVAGEFLLSSWLLFAVGVLVLFQVPRRYATARAAQRLADQWPDLTEDLGKMSQEQFRDLFREVMSSFREVDLPTVAGNMYQVHERVVVRPLPVLAKGGFLSLYAGVIALTLVTGSFDALPQIVLPHPPVRNPAPTPAPDETEPGMRAR
jgi:Zn-dependent protease